MEKGVAWTATDVLSTILSNDGEDSVLHVYVCWATWFSVVACCNLTTDGHGSTVLLVAWLVACCRLQASFAVKGNLRQN